MAYGGEHSFDIPGLNKALKVEDFEESRNIYNILPDDSEQPEILQPHIHNIAAIFVRNRAEKILGIHLVHAHFTIPQDTAMLGVNYDKPYCRWAKPTAIPSMNFRNVHGHIFVLTDHGFHPYEFQAGPAPDISGVDHAFFPELASYLNTHNLAMLVGLQVVDLHPTSMLELVLPRGTIMLEASSLKGCVPTRQTGWKFQVVNGQPRVCTALESHGTHANGHKIYNEGVPCPKLETFHDVEVALARAGILSVL